MHGRAPEAILEPGSLRNDYEGSDALATPTVLYWHRLGHHGSVLRLLGLTTQYSVGWGQLLGAATLAAIAAFVAAAGRYTVTVESLYFSRSRRLRNAVLGIWKGPLALPPDQPLPEAVLKHALSWSLDDVKRGRPRWATEPVGKEMTSGLSAECFADHGVRWTMRTVLLVIGLFSASLAAVIIFGILDSVSIDLAILGALATACGLVFMVIFPLERLKCQLELFDGTVASTS